MATCAHERKRERMRLAYADVEVDCGSGAMILPCVCVFCVAASPDETRVVFVKRLKIQCEAEFSGTPKSEKKLKKNRKKDCFTSQQII